MVLTPDKCSFVLLGVADNLQTNLVCGNKTLKSSKQEKVLGVTVDNKFNLATHLKNTKNLRNFHISESQNPRTKKFGLDSIAYRVSQLWKTIPEEIINSTSLPIFKKKKKVPLISCSCNCCRKYIHHVGFF